MDKPLIVISAININKGGTLEVLNSCLRYLSSMSNQFRTVAIVHSKNPIQHPGIEYIEIPEAKKSWIHRLYHEHITLNKISKKLAPIALWLSLHDTSPRVSADRRAVYCHNSFPFYHGKLRDLYLNYKIFFFSWMTKNFIYRPNIHQNDHIIVQTQWFRSSFQEMFGIPESKIIVFPPKKRKPIEALNSVSDPNDQTIFFYPATADVHKNFEVLCQASQLLEKRIGKGRFKTLITIQGDENRYARYLYRRWGNIDSISFIGYQNKEQMRALYEKTDALVFPSKVETWGLPITEFSSYNQPTLLADLPYAHETAGGLEKTAYFDPDRPEQLADLMYQVIDGNSQSFKPTMPTESNEPVANDWEQLFNILLQ